MTFQILDEDNARSHITLNTGGWDTMTTMDRMRRVLHQRGYSLWREWRGPFKGQLTVSSGEHAWMFTGDKLVLGAEAPTRDLEAERVERDAKAQRRKLGGYARARDLPTVHCWECMLYAAGGGQRDHGMRKEHIWGHVARRERVPELQAVAKAAGFSGARSAAVRDYLVALSHELHDGPAWPRAEQPS